MIVSRRWLQAILVAVVACDTAPSAPTETTPLIGATLGSIAAVAGEPVSIDVTSGFVDRKKQGLKYAITSSTEGASWLTMENARLSGTPGVPGVSRAQVTATDAGGDTISQVIVVVVFAKGLTAPTLPAAILGYSDARSPVPSQYFLGTVPGGSAILQSNARPENPTTDAGATLGRVLFYDRRLSRNDAISCASCHVQQFGFTDTAQFSTGFNGGKAL
jgi:cytochrome c peroxidase